MSTQLHFSNKMIFLWRKIFPGCFSCILPFCPSLPPLLPPSHALFVCMLCSVPICCATRRFHSPLWMHRSNLQVSRGSTDEKIVFRLIAHLTIELRTTMRAQHMVIMSWCSCEFSVIYFFILLQAKNKKRTTKQAQHRVYYKAFMWAWVQNKVCLTFC